MSAVPRIVVSANRRAALGLALLLLFTFGKGALWAVSVAPLDAPDEPSHFNYVVQVREGALLPVVDMVSPAGLRTPPSTPLNGDVRAWFALYGYKFFRSMPYESAQPPLYYWAAALWSRPVPVTASRLPTLLLALRLFSVVLGTGAVFALWLACRWNLPAGKSWLGWAAPLALTLSPQFSFATATVSNDAGVLFWGAALLALWAYGLRAAHVQSNAGTPPLLLVVGAAAVVTAAGTLTKLTFLASLPATALWLLWLAAVRHERTGVELLRRWLVLGVAFVALLCILLVPWVARNVWVYGEPTGFQGIFNIMHGIYWQRNNFPVEQVFTQIPLDEFITRSVRSFWALFGWASVGLPGWVYWLLTAFVGVSALGALPKRGSDLRARPATPLDKLLALSLVSYALGLANYVAYNSLVEFQPQLRFTFFALAPLVLLLAAGLSNFPWPPARKPLTAAFLAALALAHLLSLQALGGKT